MGAMMPAEMSGSWSYGHACGLRASLPVAPPRVPLATRKFKALISLLDRSAVEIIGSCWGRNEQGRKYRRQCCGNRELTHCLLPQFCKPTMGCINFT